jgi:hypothetical protein
MIKRESQNSLGWRKMRHRPKGNHWHTQSRNDRSKIVSPRSQFLPLPWVSGSERKKMATPSIQKGRSIRILTSSKGTTTKRKSLQLDSIFSSLQKNLLFLPSNLLASWQTIPKTFLLAANSQRNEVVEFKLSRGLYICISIPFLDSLSFFLHKIRNGIQTPQLPKKEFWETLVQG